MEMIIPKTRNTASVIELNAFEIDEISGGHVVAVVAAATAVVTLGESALNFGRNLGATIYRVFH